MVMQQEGLVPNWTTRNTAISSGDIAEQPNKVLELLEKLRQQELEPDMITRNAAISAFKGIAAGQGAGTCWGDAAERPAA